MRIKQLAAGSVHSLAVTHEGQVYAFGSNRDGQMGFDLLMSSVIMVPQLVRSLESLFITAVSAGDHHSLFLSNQGRVYSCGWSRYGVLGYTIDGQQALPKMIDALASVKIVGISAGARPWRRNRVAIVRASADSERETLDARVVHRRVSQPGGLRGGWAVFVRV